VDVYFQSYSSAGVPNGANVKVTTATSDESNPKTNSPDQYGDYMGIAASGGFAFPVWTDHRISSKSGSEEIYVDPPLPFPGGDGAALLLSANAAASAELGTVAPADLGPLSPPSSAESTPRTANDLNIPAASATPSSDDAAELAPNQAQPMDMLEALFASLGAAMSLDGSM
jgi:hypothetical protein